MKHTHHIQPLHLGGTDDEWNLINIDFIEHAKLHAQRFLDGLDRRFDFRHEGWKHLDNELRAQVLEKTAQVTSENCNLTQEDRIRGGTTQGRRCAELKLGVCGRSPEQMAADGKKGGPKGGAVQGRRNAENLTGFCNPDVQRSNAQKLNKKRVRCTITGRISTPGGLSRFQQGQGIDHTNPLNREELK
jgi:hypothetical protein